MGSGTFEASLYMVFIDNTILLMLLPFVVSVALLVVYICK